MQSPAPTYVRGRGGTSKPVLGLDLEARAQFRRVVVMTGHFANAGYLANEATRLIKLIAIEPLARVTRDMVNLAAFNQQKAKRAEVMPDDMRADHRERTPLIEAAIGHKKPVIAEAVFEAPFDMPLIDRGEYLKGAHVSKLPSGNRSTMQHDFTDRNLSLAL